MSLAPLLTAFVVPPLNAMPAGYIGAAIGLRRRRIGMAIVLASLTLLLLLSLPAIGGRLLLTLETGLPLTPSAANPPRAIVVLSAELARADAGLAIGPLSLERDVAGASLARATRLPVLIAGGTPTGDSISLAAAMGAVMAADLGVTPRWLEEESQDTRQNLRFAARMLRPEGIGSVYVVTNAWHMPRALVACREAGLVCTAAPVRLDRAPRLSADTLAPGIGGWRDSYFALHEWIGLLWYRLHG